MKERVDLALYRLAIHEQGDVSRLHGELGSEYGLRVGDYRVRFALPSGTEEIVVLYVRPRGRAYKE